MYINITKQPIWGDLLTGVDMLNLNYGHRSINPKAQSHCVVRPGALQTFLPTLKRIRPWDPHWVSAPGYALLPHYLSTPPLYPIVENPRFSPGLHGGPFRALLDSQCYQGSHFLGSTHWPSLSALTSASSRYHLDFWSALQLRHFLNSLPPPDSFQQQLTPFKQLWEETGPLPHSIHTAIPPVLYREVILNGCSSGRRGIHSGCWARLVVWTRLSLGLSPDRAPPFSDAYSRECISL